MKVRMIVPAQWCPEGKEPLRVHACPSGENIPDGYIEVELESTTYCGTRMSMTGPYDSCKCGHDRADHIEHSGECLMPIASGGTCNCMRFQED